MYTTVKLESQTPRKALFAEERIAHLIREIEIYCGGPPAGVRWDILEESRLAISYVINDPEAVAYVTEVLSFMERIKENG